MNRAEYEAVNNRIAAVEARCELLEAELKALKTAPLEAALEAELNRQPKKPEKRVGA